MSKTNIDSELRSRVDAFVSDLSEIIHQAALESVREALEGGAPARRGPGRSRKSGTRKAAKKASKRGGRVRRSSEDLEKLSASFLSYVKSHPGERLEQIGVGMGIATKELKRPVQLLMEAGSIRTEGQRRGTQYFAGAGKRKVSKKAGKRRATKKAGKRRTTKKRTKSSKRNS